MNEPNRKIEQLLSELNQRAAVVIALLLNAISPSGEKLKLKEQVRLLSNLGVRPKDIATILGRTPKHAHKELAGLRKGAKSGNKKQRQRP